MEPIDLLAKFAFERQQAFASEMDPVVKRSMFREVLKEATIDKEGLLHIEFLNGWTAAVDLANLPHTYDMPVPVEGNGKTVFIPLSIATRDRRRDTKAVREDVENALPTSDADEPHKPFKT